MNISDIESTFNEAKNNINLTSDLESLDNIRVAMLGKKGVITAYAKSLKDLSLDDKKKFSPIINKYKNELQNIIDNKKKEIENNIYQEKLAQEK